MKWKNMTSHFYIKSFFWKIYWKDCNFYARFYLHISFMHFISIKILLRLIKCSNAHCDHSNTNINICVYLLLCDGVNSFLLFSLSLCLWEKNFIFYLKNGNDKMLYIIYQNTCGHFEITFYIYRVCNFLRLKNVLIIIFIPVCYFPLHKMESYKRVRHR